MATWLINIFLDSFFAFNGSQKRNDIVRHDSQLTALGKRIQDEVEEFIEKDLSSSSQRKRPTKANPYATAAKVVDFWELVKRSKVSEVVATQTGYSFFNAIAKLVTKFLELPVKALMVVPVRGAQTSAW